MQILGYERAYRFTADAVHTLCCSHGTMRDRLQRIDRELFTLGTSDIPESGALRENFRKLHELVTSKDARYSYEGRIVSTLDQLHHTKLRVIAELIWDIYMEFLALMRNDDTSPQ